MRRDLLIDGMYGFERWRFCFWFDLCMTILFANHPATAKLGNWSFDCFIRSYIPRSPILSHVSWSRKDYHGIVKDKSILHENKCFTSSVSQCICP
jgi:hypothetical protein